MLGSDFFSNLTLVLIFHGQKMGSKTGFDGYVGFLRCTM